MKQALIITLIIFLFLNHNGFSQSKNFIDQPYLETTAKVDSLVQPDRIYLSILISAIIITGDRVSIILIFGIFLLNL